MINSYIVHDVVHVQWGSYSVAVYILHYIATLHVIYIATHVTRPSLVS